MPLLITLKYIWRSFSLGCHLHVHFSHPWHAFASHGLPAIAELLVIYSRTNLTWKRTQNVQTSARRSSRVLSKRIISCRMYFCRIAKFGEDRGPMLKLSRANASGRFFGTAVLTSNFDLYLSKVKGDIWSRWRKSMEIFPWKSDFREITTRVTNKWTN